MDRGSIGADHDMARRLAAVLDTVLDAIITIDETGRIGTVNAAVETMFGYAPDEMIGRNVKILMPEPYATEHDGYLANYLASGDAKIIGIGREVFGRRKDGTVFPMRLAVGEMRQDGQRAFVGILHDITEQKRIETELNDSSERMRAILDAVLDGIITIDGRGIIDSFNPGAEEIFGYEAREVIGRNVKMLMPDPYAGEHDGYLARYQETGEAQIIGVGREVTGRRKDGSLFPMDLAVTEMTVGNRRMFTGLVRDITQRKRAEERTQEAKEAAETANKAKSEFLANMSHELRTPLNAIIGYSEMLREDAEESGFRDQIPDLDRIHGAGRHLLSLINDVLDLAKVEAGKVEFLVEEVPLTALARDLEGMAHPLMEKNGNRLTVVCPDDIGTIESDPTKLRQILFNLLSNAAKFTKRGNVELSLVRGTQDGSPDGDGSEEIVFTVRDEGIGMSDDQVSKVFESFVQANASTTREYGGTGLGLAIVRRFCELLGGSVAVGSAPGEGSTFTVRMPVRFAPTEGARADKSSVQPEPDAGGAEVYGDGPTILVIDDEATAREIMARHLARAGYRAVTAANGTEGIRMALDLQPAAITLDVIMPGLDGWVVLQRLKSNPATAAIPVVMCTIVDEAGRGFSLGASDFLNKPVDRLRLASILARHGADGGGGKVLVVEDDDATRDLLERAIAKTGCGVVTAENGGVALDRLAGCRPSLIILDLMMPEMDGFQFVEEMQKVPEWRDIPVVVLTAKDVTQEDRLRLNGYVAEIMRKEDHDTETMLQAVLGRVQALTGGD